MRDREFVTQNFDRNRLAMVATWTYSSPSPGIDPRGTMAKIFITGATGFTGRYVVRRLAEGGALPDGLRPAR